MSYMNRLWIEMEQERAERALEIAAMALTPTNPPPTNVVSVCLRNINFWTTYTCSCPTLNCNNGNWSHILLRDDPLVRCADDAAAITTRCLICGSQMPLWQFLASSDEHKRLYQEVRDWMKKGSLGPGMAAAISSAYKPQYKMVPTDAAAAKKMMEIFYAKPLGDFLAYPKVEEGGCETDKPIGTRDPDKFLKEQQNKLWAEMMR